MEVACFLGGYGIDFFEQCAREYEKMHPHVTINVWGNPRVWEQLIPRFASGTPPDLCWPGWGINKWSLVLNGQVYPMGEHLQQPAYGVDKKWIDTFVPSLLEVGRYDGHYYLLPHNLDTFGWWYNERLFEEHGWSPPRTYGQLLELCEAIKKEHIAPVTFAGRAPVYALWGFFFPWAISAGGIEVYNRAQNLEPGAWKDPAFLKAARCVMEMKRRGYFQGGLVGMSGTESQMEFLVGRAAMIPCGSWLHNEMKDVIPSDFRMEFIRGPVFEEGVGDPTCMFGDGSDWLVPAKAKHPDVASDFFRYMTSPDKAREFLEQKGSLMCIADLGEVKVPSYMEKPLQFVNQAKSLWGIEYSVWYPELETEIQNAFIDFYCELLTPEEFVERVEKAATITREDPSIPKFKIK